MKKNVNLYIHPGYGKTGSTLLQEKIFSKINFICLSKPFKTSQYPEIKELQTKLFIPKYSFDQIYPLNFSRAIEQYSNYLKKILHGTKIENFILSDECIFDRINYFGYFNIYLLKEIIDILKKEFSLNLKFIVSIRRQHDLVPSLYAFDNFRQKKNFGSLSNFIELLEIEEDLKRIFFYDELIERIKNNFNSEILILPIEELSLNKSSYIQKLEDFLKVKLNDLDWSNHNVNSINVNDQIKYKVRTLDFRSSVMSMVSNMHFFFLRRNNFYKKNFTKLRFLKKYLNPKISYKNVITLNNDQIIKIKNLYKDSIKKLAKNLNIDLEKLDYF